MIMGYINNSEVPELLYVIDNESNKELQNIEKMISNMNESLIDSGFEQYQFKLEIIGKKVYVKKVK